MTQDGINATILILVNSIYLLLLVCRGCKKILFSVSIFALIKKILIGFGEQSYSIHIFIIYCNKTKKETSYDTG